MNRLVPLKCKSCGIEAESGFSVSGQHVKQECRNCLTYIKFYKQEELPTIADIKARIFDLNDKDLKKVNDLKNKVEFEETAVPNKRFCEYWKLYLASRDGSSVSKQGELGL